MSGSHGDTCEDASKIICVSKRTYKYITLGIVEIQTFIIDIHVATLETTLPVKQFLQNIRCCGFCRTEGK